MQLIMSVSLLPGPFHLTTHRRVAWFNFLNEFPVEAAKYGIQRVGS